MVDLVHERALVLTDDAGRVFARVSVYGEPQRGNWAGWVEFRSSDGQTVLRTDRETTQSSLEGVAYWARGLEPLYLDGALERAAHRSEGERIPLRRRSAGIAQLCIETCDRIALLRLMATRTLVPGQRRRINAGGGLVYERGMRSEDTLPSAYHLAAEFRSENAAALIANALWNELHRVQATLAVDGAHTPIRHTAIKKALVRAV